MEDSRINKYALWILIQRTVRILSKVRQQELNKFRTTLRITAVLGTILRLGDKATLENISHQVVLERHSMSSQLIRMEKGGLIKRVKDTKKKNMMSIQITEKGYATYINAVKTVIINKILEVLTEEERHSIWTIIAKLRRQAMMELGKDDSNQYPTSDPLMKLMEEVDLHFIKVRSQIGAK